MSRATTSTRDVSAGCFVCWGEAAHWTSANAQALAAQHHDRTGHRTWCDIYLVVRYGTGFNDPRQVDIEESIAAAAAPDTGRQPEVATRPVPDAPAVPAAGVSAPESRSSRRAADRPRGARGHQPETQHG